VSRIAVGIDLGTSTSEVVIFMNGETSSIRDPKTRSPIIPSVVGIDKKSGRLLIGNDALRFRGVEGSFVQEVKRQMGTESTVSLGDSQYKPEEISALILKHLKRLVESTYNEEIKEAVITVPANFPNAARKATLAAAEIAGMRVLKLINEPTAAAMAFGIKNMEAEENLLVFDWGGGTLDVTILEMMQGILDVKSSYGDPQLGGKDFDQVLSEFVISSFRKKHPDAHIVISDIELRAEVKKLKESLSTEENADIYLPAFAKEGKELITLDLLVSKSEFEQAVIPLINRAKNVIEEALSKKNNTRESITRVLCVGGTTYIPAVRKMLDDFFPGKVSVDVDPDLAVSIGAAVEAASQCGLISRQNGLITTDVSPYGIGVEIVSIIGNQPMLVYDPLIEPNTALPFSISRDYTLLREDQTALEMRIMQSHKSGPQRVEDTIYTGISASIEKIPVSKSGIPHPVEVSFSYDNNGLINLKALIPSTGNDAVISMKDSEIMMTDQEKQKSATRLDRLLNEDRLYTKHRAIIERAENLISTESITEDQLELIGSLLVQLKKAISCNDDEESDRLSEKLSFEIFDIENL